MGLIGLIIGVIIGLVILIAVDFMAFYIINKIDPRINREDYD